MSLIHQVLTQYWGYSQFRPLQEDIIRSIMEGKDTLALLPTGGGKSMCFQVPAMAQPGLCLVISPLIALMKDQEEQLKEKGIRAVAIVSGMKKSEVEIALQNCIHGDYKFLYVSPERLASPVFVESLSEMKLNMIAVDEAHCISQWGYDFRPPYLKIAEIRTLFPKVPILALTASATPEVREDIMQRLAFKDGQVYSKSFARPNLSYVVRPTEDKMGQLLKILNTIPGTGIVYVRNRRKTQEIAQELKRNRIAADFYHAGLDHQTRFERQDQWMKNKTRVIVATNAFGMGINKPEVRTVVHLDLPDDLESYYQEAGRGGRDEKPAFAVVLYDNADLADLESRYITNFPERDEIRRVYQALGNYLQIAIDSGSNITSEFELVSFCAHYKFETLKTLSCLRLLEMAEYITTSDAIYLPARIRIPIKQMELYKFQVEQPRFDQLIKTILRSYTGLFDDYVRFSEKELARRIQLEPAALKSQLDQLTKLGVIDYIPATDKPTLTFIQPRVKESDLYISSAILEKRKERFKLRADAFRNFLTNPHQCRSMLLLSYFGEKNLTRCGTCDYCRERNKVELNDLEIEEFSIQLKKLLNNNPLPPSEIAGNFPGIPIEKLQATLRWLMDNGEFAVDLKGRMMSVKE
jgi:ATP-dependent DNA helicase RecQ